PFRHICTPRTTVVPNARIFGAALYDFGNMTFPEFLELSAESKGLCIHACFQQMSLVESTYRSIHHFPRDADTYFASYTTIENEETLERFFDDCPFETNIEEAKSALKGNMKRTKIMNRDFFRRIKPDDVEFCALLGLAFWSNGLACVNDELSAAAQKIRGVILKEMHVVYKSRGIADYATRLGELFCLLDNLEEDVSLTAQDIEVFRLLNLWNEAFQVTDPKED
ncbi:hypothetical protein PMAYCL1PPCAC_15341, partial [Pristionchus mayeri]